MLISFIFSYSENFFVVFYLSFYSVLGQGPSARDISSSSAISKNALMLVSLKSINTGTIPITAVPVSLLLNQGPLPYVLL